MVSARKSVEQSGEDEERGHASLCLVCLHDGESGDSIKFSVLLLSCLGLVLSLKDVAALNGFKMFCLVLGRFVFVRCCGSSFTDSFAEEKLNREWVC